MKAFILQGLPPTHTNWKRERGEGDFLSDKYFNSAFFVCLVFFLQLKTWEYYFDVTKHGRQVVGWGPQAEVVEDVIFQRFQVGVVDTHWAERWGDKVKHCRRIRQPRKLRNPNNIRQSWLQDSCRRPSASVEFSTFKSGRKSCLRDTMLCNFDATIPLPACPQLKGLWLDCSDTVVHLSVNQSFMKEQHLFFCFGAEVVSFIYKNKQLT